MTVAELELWREMVLVRDVLLFWLVGFGLLGWFLFERYVSRMEKAIKECSLCRAKVHG